MAGNGYIKSLDGIRAIAIILVMSLHGGITYFGWIGVQLFFVLSGFLITGILWKDKEGDGPLSYKLKKFWIRRSLRIFPLYFGYLLVLGILYFFSHLPGDYRTYIPYLVTYSFNFTRTFPEWRWDSAFTHFWSLSIEEQFYLLFPLIILLSPRRFIRIFMILIIVIAPLSRLIIGQYFRNKGFNGESLADIVYWNTFSHLDAFFMGGIIPVLSLDKHIKKPHFLLAGSFLLALLAGIWEFTHYAAHKSYLRDLGYSIGQSANYEYVWHYSCLNLFFASLILVFVSIHSKQRFFRLRRILESKWLVNIGRVSYSMYIFHWLIWIHLFKYLLQPETYLFRIALFIPYLIVVYLFAELSYKFYEAPFIRLKDRFFPRSGIPAKELPVRPLLK